MNTIHESVVLIGGGGGVYRIARFLKRIRPNITTIQTMFDRGRHSGKLRDERGVLPPGDIRQAILALADDELESDLRELLAYRFTRKNNSSLDDATVGNILLTALTEITGSTMAAIAVLCRWFRVSGKVLPISLCHADLCVELDDGTVLKGEGLIDTRSTTDTRVIARAFLEPAAHLHPLAYEAIKHADKVVFCPGDLYTSIVPNTLVNGFKEAAAESRAAFILVVNIMTKKSETDGFTAADFARIILSHVGRKAFDAVICNSAAIPQRIMKRYRAERSFPVRIDEKRLGRFTKVIVAENLVDESGGVLRHHERTAALIADL